MTIQIAFDNSYARLGESFSTRQSPVSVATPRLIAFDHDLARGLGLDPEALVTAEGVNYLAGNNVPPGAELIATAYAGPSSAASCRNSAMDERCCWAKLSTRMESGATFS